MSNKNSSTDASSANLVTYIARASDGQILVSSFEGSHAQQAPNDFSKRQIRLVKDSPTSNKGFIEEHGYIFYFQIVSGIILVIFSMPRFSRSVMINYASEVADTFISEYSTSLPVFNRPYAAVAFISQLEKIRKRSLDPSVTDNYSRIRANLSDVMTTMDSNLLELLNRGEFLERTSLKSQQLIEKSKAFKKQAQYANYLATLKMYGPLIGIALFVLFYLYYKFR